MEYATLKSPLDTAKIAEMVFKCKGCCITMVSSNYDDMYHLKVILNNK